MFEATKRAPKSMNSDQLEKEFWKQKSSKKHAPIYGTEDSILHRIQNSFLHRIQNIFLHRIL